MEVMVGNVIEIKNPSDDLLLWCMQNLKLDNPEYSKKIRMGFYVGNTPKYLYLYEVHGEKLILPYGTLKQIQPFIKDSIVKSNFKPFETIDYGKPIPLYPYQEQALQQAKNGLYGILQSRAGSGKTQIGLALIKAYGRRALWLTHTADLLNQSKERAERYIDKNLIGTITEGKVNIGKGVTFATIQTMCKLDISKYKDIWDVVIVDEGHRVCGSPTQVTMFAKVLNGLSARHKYGLSATVHRADGLIKATFSLLGEVVYSVPDEAVADRVMQVGIKPIGTGVGIGRGCINTDGTLNYTRLITYLSSNEARNEFISRIIASEYEHSCLILSDRLDHLEMLKNLLPIQLQKYALMISGKMTTKKGKAEREQAIEDMRNGDKRFLFATYSLAKEGIDIPRLDRLFLASPQRDYAVITQSIGRVARVHEGKSNPIVYDFVDDIGYLVKSYKKRCTTYRKNNCYFITEDE